VKRVILIEDNRNLAVGLRNNLEIEGYMVELAMDGATGLELARSVPADVIILDLMLPELDGYRVLRALREEGCDTPILILSARGAETDKVLGFQLGADDYVAKPFGLLELMARVEALRRRASGRHAPPRLTERARFGTVDVDPSTRTVRRDGMDVALRPKEFDLLAALIQRRGDVVSRDELLHQVWGYADEVFSRTVDTHVAELRRKLEPDPARPRHILTVRKAGYRLVS
jgi:DNA-binding response OmpR family regulator